jgi:hypothetical protein
MRFVVRLYPNVSGDEARRAVTEHALPADPSRMAWAKDQSERRHCGILEVLEAEIPVQVLSNCVEQVWSFWSFWPIVLAPKSLIYKAVQIALLTIYDMCKAVDRGMTINGVRLLEKQGGKSGHYVAG